MLKRIEMRTLICGSLLVFVCISPTMAQQIPATVSLIDSSYVRIGSVEGPPETVFAGIVGALRLPSGHIAVADGGNYVVRFFDASGVHLRSFGREGSGPNEFQILWWIGACPDGELLAVDAALSRGAVMSAADESLLRTVRLPSEIRFNQYLSCEAGGNVIVLLNRPREVAPRGQVAQFPAAVVRVSLDSAAQDTLARLPGTDYYFAEKVAGYSTVPLGAQAMSAAGAGRVYAAQSNEGHIQVIDLQTGRRTAFRHGLAQPTLTTAAWESAKSALIEQTPLHDTRTLLKDVLAEAPAPRTHPPFVDMKADRAGRLWLRLPSSTSSADWRVLGPDGRHVGSVRLRSNVDPLDIGESHIVAVERDSLGVQTILVYSFSSPFIRQ